MTLNKFKLKENIYMYIYKYKLTSSLQFTALIWL